MYRVQFKSDADQHRFRETLRMRYPDNLIDEDLPKRVTILKGDKPSTVLEQFAKQHNGVWL